MPPRKRRHVTIKDIAREVGVSHTAVSMALRGATGVSEATRKRILKQARSMNYQPRIAARLLRSRSTGQIGLIMSGAPTMESSAGIFMPLFSSFVSLCEHEGIAYHIEYVRNDEVGPGQLPQQLVGRLVDGALTVGYLGRELREMVTDYPWVSIDEPAPHCVLSDTRQGVVEAVRSLVDLGHRRIGYVGGPTRYNMHRLGLEGYRHAIEFLELESPADDWVYELRMEYANAVAEAVDWSVRTLDSDFAPTGFVVNDMRVARALIYVAMDRGLRVPDDLSVIGTGMGRDALVGWPLLSSMESDFDGMMRTGFDLLRARIDGGDPPEGVHLIPPQVRHRDTTGAAPGS